MSLYDVFRSGLSRGPERPALRIGPGEWTYAWLEERSRQWADSILGALQPGRPPIVALLAGRGSPDLFAALLGCSRAGCTYVPLGAQWPALRLREVCDLIRPALIVDPGHRLDDPGLHSVVPPDAPVPRLCAPAANPAPATLQTSDLAYLLFTSGSTGTPKGVPISNANLATFAADVDHDYPMDGGVVSSVHELTFDLSVFELVAAWGSGSVLDVFDRLQVLRADLLLDRRRVTCFTATPSLVTVLLERGLAAGRLPRVQWSVFCGEPLSRRLAERWRRVCPQAVIDNTYGPTEATVACTRYRWPLGAPLPPLDQVPVGKPLAGTMVALWDGVREARTAGELLISGGQVFGGYLDPAHDVGHFVELGGRRWYGSGDLFERTVDGHLLHRGRLDRQVKVRGYRIELGELESALHGITGLEAVAVPSDDGRQLVGVVVGHCDIEVTRARLAETLPAHLLPTRMLQVEELPLTPNGKTDFALLLELALGDPAESRTTRDPIGGGAPF